MKQPSRTAITTAGAIGLVGVMTLATTGASATTQTSERAGPAASLVGPAAALMTGTQADAPTATKTHSLDDGKVVPMKSYDLSAGWGHSSGPHAGRHHNGLDMAGPSGLKIYSATDGRVIHAGNGGGYGLLVKVRTSDKHTILYAHQSRMLVHKGDKVKAGDLLGHVGSTGYSTGPHLHFEVHSSKGDPINPSKYLGSTEKKLARLGR